MPAFRHSDRRGREIEKGERDRIEYVIYSERRISEWYQQKESKRQERYREIEIKIDR